jgi:uncharacterized ferritin-like protein (DUF455 family)
MSSLRIAALGPWAEADPVKKAQATLALDLSMPVRAHEALQAPCRSPGRPAKPALLPHTHIKAKSLTTPEGRAILLHSITHIELNAIDLALDVVWRFADMPDAFYTDWVRIAQELSLIHISEPTRR